MHVIIFGAAHRAVLALIEQTDLDWSAVCPPCITNDEATGSYRVTADNMPSGTLKVSKWDLAAFTVSQVTDNSYLRKRVGITGTDAR
jgi:putative NADH-flavin reductase